MTRDRLEFIMRVIRTVAAFLSTLVNVYIFMKVFLRH
jgi:hypothetical protein